jgi:hydroxymethylpyrimidine pyrophosphatase-like HAD family hydrolase
MSETRSDWIATDLDGTLFARGVSDHAIAATWKRAETPGDAPVASSWMPAPRHALLSGLVRLFRVVPVTARDLDSFSRVSIKGVPLEDGAIIANGAILLCPGTMTPDPEWDEELAPRLAEWAGPLAEMAATLLEQSGGRVVPRLVASHTRHPAYLVAKAADGFWSAAEGLGLREALAPFRCRIAEVGRELQVLPPPVGKRLGLAAFSRRFMQGVPPLLAFGDMPEDLGFLNEAAFMATPTGSKLAETWRHES